MAASRSPRLVVTGYGRAALDELAATVQAAQEGDKLAPVTVIVANNGVGIAARRALARNGPGVAGVTFTTVSRLAEQFGRHRLVAAGRRPASGVLTLGALRAELDRDPGVFGTVSAHRATEDALIRVHRELTGLSPAALARLRSQSRRSADVVRLHQATRRRLAEAWFDEGDLFDAARAELDEHPQGATSLGRLVVFLPQMLSSRALGFLAVAAARVPTTVIVALAGDPEADADITTILDELNLPMPLALAPAAPPLTLRSVADADDEVRHAIRELVTAAKDGVALDRCALLYTSAEPYARVVADALTAANITWHGPSPRGLADTVVGRTLLLALDLAAATGATSFDRVRLFTFFSSAPLRATSGALMPVSSWERISRKAGVLAGADHFRARLTAFITNEQARALALNDEYADEAPRMTRSAELATSLLAEVNDLDQRFDALRTASQWTELVRVARALLRRLLGGENLMAEWPAHERRAADAIDEVLGELSQLDAVGVPADLVTFARLASHAIDSRAVRAGRLGAGVLVGRLDEIIGHHVELVVVVGAAEGLLPGPISDDPLLPDRERLASGEMVTASRIAARQHRAFIAALRAGERCVVSWPRGDLRQNLDRNRSRWIPAEGNNEARTEEHVASFAAAVASLKVPGTATDARLRAMAAGLDPTDAGFRRGELLIGARTGRTLSEFDGDLSRLAAVNAAGFDLRHPVSATRLQTWVTCPYSYFVRYVLGAEAIEDPAIEMTINPLDKGNLIHEVLDRLVREAIDKSAPIDLASVAPLFAEVAAEAAAEGRTGRALYWQRDSDEVYDHLNTFVASDIARLAGRSAAPIATELAFGRRGQPTADITLPDGRVVRFTGAIDRVDRSRFGQLLVTDYKSGKSTRYAKLASDNPTLGGKFLQLPVYAAAARMLLGGASTPIESAFRFVGESTTDKGYVVDDAVMARFADDLAVIVDGITSGLFPSRPEASSQVYTPCVYCDPDGFGTADLQRIWAEKRRDSRLATYLVLVGIGDDDADTAESEDAS